MCADCGHPPSDHTDRAVTPYHCLPPAGPTGFSTTLCGCKGWRIHRTPAEHFALGDAAAYVRALLTDAFPWLNLPDPDTAPTAKPSLFDKAAA